MLAQAILGPGARQSHVELLRCTGLSLDTVSEFHCEANADLFVVLGGDGTVHRFLPELILCKKPVLIVPCGSGNDLARSIRIRSVADAVNVARDFAQGKAVSREIDIGFISDPTGKQTPFCCTAGVGLDAGAGEFANRMPRWLRAHGGYLIAALSGVLANPIMELTISTDAALAGKVEQLACLFTIANTPSFGGGLAIAPEARVEDGEFDCILADAMSRARLARAAIALLRGTHLSLPEVHLLRACSVRVESDYPVRVYADGEFVCETPVNVRMMPKALRVCTAKA